MLAKERNKFRDWMFESLKKCLCSKYTELYVVIWGKALFFDS